MARAKANPVVHLELHTGNLPAALSFYGALCDWRQERIETAAGAYHALELGRGLDGGVVECAARRPLWLPYVEVSDVPAATDLARALGAAVLLEPCEGRAGWRSVVATPAAGELALWQPKRPRPPNVPEPAP